MTVLLIFALAVYVFSAIGCMIYFSGEVDRSRTAGAMGKAHYLASAYFASFIPVLNTAIVLSAIYQVRLSNNKDKIELERQINEYERGREKELLKLQTKAEEKMFNMDPELWCDHHNLRFVPDKKFHEYWNEIHQYPVTINEAFKA